MKIIDKTFVQFNMLVIISFALLSSISCLHHVNSGLVFIR
jgi:hypothetical protein